MLLRGKVYYVGVNDRHKDLFEGLWPLPFGVSYNSYLIADEKVALVDTVEVDFFPRYIQKLRDILGERPIDYLIVNHMEPDHSSSIALIRKYYPSVTIVGNKKTLSMVEGYYGEAGSTLTVAEGDVLPLGHHQLKFYLTPMVHWPETMMTFDETDHILFSGDAFGCFGALNGAVVDAKMDVQPFFPEMRRYYSNIVGKYGGPVQRALQKLAAVDIQMICSTHGPVWTEYIGEVVAEYDRMSLYQAKKGVVIAYASMYGNTEEMAEAVAEELAVKGITHIVMHDLSRTHYSYTLSDIFSYQGLIVGCPTYNGRLYPYMESLLREIAGREVKGRVMGYFGSYTWVSAIDKNLKDWAEKLKFELVGQPFENKQGVGADSLESCRALADAMADKLEAM